MLPGANAGFVMPQRVAAIMSQCSNALANWCRFCGLCRSQCSSLAFGRIDAAAPVNYFETTAMRRARDLSGLLPRAVIAPEVIVVEWLHPLIDGNHTRAGSIDGDRFNDIPTNARIS